MKNIVILIVSLLLLGSCKSDDAAEIDTGIDPSLFADVDLYYTGEALNPNGGYDLKYWKNDSIVDIPVTETPMATAIELHGSDVLISGFLSETEGYSSLPLKGFIWKNGTPLYELKGDEGQRVRTDAMVVSGDNVHAAGVIDSWSLAYWKNGVLQKWTNNADFVRVNAMDVVGNDVYIVGDIQRPGQPNHVINYWKNGTAKVVSDPDGLAYAADIKVVGNDVYVLGTNVKGGYQIALWKNGVRTDIGEKYIFGYATCLFIENKDIYVGAYMQPKGGHIMPLIFKNGGRLPLENDTENQGRLSDIYVFSGDVYALGSQNNVGVIWKNGKQYVIKAKNTGLTSLRKITGVPKAVY